MFFNQASVKASKCGCICSWIVVTIIVLNNFCSRLNSPSDVIQSLPSLIRLQIWQQKMKKSPRFKCNIFLTTFASFLCHFWADFMLILRPFTTFCERFSVVFKSLLGCFYADFCDVLCGVLSTSIVTRPHPLLICCVTRRRVRKDKFIPSPIILQS